MPEFAVGDYVQITCRDGAIFVGVITTAERDYFTLNGYGHLYENVETMEYA